MPIDAVMLRQPWNSVFSASGVQPPNPHSFSKVGAEDAWQCRKLVCKKSYRCQAEIKKKTDTGVSNVAAVL